MGTRNLVVAIKNDQIKVAQYGQFDGYFEGVGEDIASFVRGVLSNPTLKEKFNTNLEKCNFVDYEFINSLQVECGMEPNQEWVSFGDPAYNKFLNLYPQFDRDTAANVFQLILDKPINLKNSFDFGENSLSCEFAYVLNMDTDELEIYTGFNTDVDEHIESKYFRWGKDKNEYGYYPVKLFSIVSFDELINNTNYMSELDSKE